MHQNAGRLCLRFDLEMTCLVGGSSRTFNMNRHKHLADRMTVQSNTFSPKVFPLTLHWTLARCDRVFYDGVHPQSWQRTRCFSATLSLSHDIGQLFGVHVPCELSLSFDVCSKCSGISEFGKHGTCAGVNKVQVASTSIRQSCNADKSNDQMKYL